MSVLGPTKFWLYDLWDRMGRPLEKKYRVASNDTGPGVGWPYRFSLQAGWWASYYEYVEGMAGIESKGWKVQKRVRRNV